MVEKHGAKASARSIDTPRRAASVAPLMCCRYVLLQQHLREALAKLGIAGHSALPPSRYNIPPGGGILAVRNTVPSRSGAASPNPPAARELATLQWGLVPAWARSADGAPVNARAESLAERPSFRDAFRARRCLLPASGFYEWQPRGRTRQPWLFRRRDEGPFCLAGVWEIWRAPDGSVLESCAIITTTPNAVMIPIHPRMPVMLAEEHYDRWLDPATAAAELSSLLRPFDSAAMQAHPVSPRVNTPNFDEAACLAPVDPTPEPEDAQLGLPLG